MENAADQESGRHDADEEERAALVPADYTDAGVVPPDWTNDPIPSLDTWRLWQTAQNKALAYKRGKARTDAAD